MTISTANLEPFPNLLRFLFYDNEITSIDGDLFQHNPLLRYVDFNVNQTQHVGNDLVKDLKDLEFLYFFSNPCVNSYAINNQTAFMWLNDQLPVLCPPTTIEINFIF